jgi:hypothetical protein
MNVSGQNLFRLLRILSLPAYAVLLVSLALIAGERFLFSFDSIAVYYTIIGAVFFAVYGWFVSIASTIGVLGCYARLLRRRDLAVCMRGWASPIALRTAVAFAVSYKIVPLIILAP